MAREAKVEASAGMREVAGDRVGQVELRVAEAPQVAPEGTQAEAAPEAAGEDRAGAASAAVASQVAATQVAREVAREVAAGFQGAEEMVGGTVQQEPAPMAPATAEAAALALVVMASATLLLVVLAMAMARHLMEGAVVGEVGDIALPGVAPRRCYLCHQRASLAVWQGLQNQAAWLSTTQN